MKKNQAFKRVFKKLEAVRATLPTAEREVLDNIIVAENEVEAHSMNRGVSKAAAKAVSKGTVRAHSMKRGVSKATSKAVSKSAVKSS